MSDGNREPDGWVMNGWRAAELYELLERWKDAGSSEAARAMVSSRASRDAISSADGGGTGRKNSPCS